MQAFNRVNATRLVHAIVYDRYGPPEVLEVRQLPSPQPGPNQVLVSVRAAALNPKDSLIRKGKFRRLTGNRFPRQLGFDVAGVVAALGQGVNRLQVGDEVFGMMNGWGGGTVAQQVCLLVSELALKPQGVSFEEAAAIPLSALTALQALRDEGKVGPNARVLIHGASGGVGVHAIQLARILGAHVTTTSSAKNVDLCRELGAHEAWDYAERTGLEKHSDWNVFFDVFGNRSFGQVRGALAAKATYVSTVPSVRLILQQGLTRFFGKRAKLVIVNSNTQDLELLARWIEEGKLKPVLDRVVPLIDVPAAQAHIETKRARGKVVIQMTSEFRDV